MLKPWEKVAVTLGPAIFSVAFFTGAQFYESQPGWDAVEINRDGQEDFVVDFNLLTIDVFGALFAVQAINHTLMLTVGARRRNENQAHEGPD
jgi:hypothetical protein